MNCLIFQIRENNLKPIMVGAQKHIAFYDLSEFNGRAFFTTDLHGHFDLLHCAMLDNNFDTDTDLLFVGGDSTDRHSDSKSVLDYINEPWFISIQGNHEALFIGAYDENWCGPYTNCLLSNGGEWVSSLTKGMTFSIYTAFKSLPLGIEILLPSGDKVGIIHSQVPYDDWEQFKEITKAELEWNGLNTCQWARDKYDNQISVPVKNVDLVLSGHTPTNSGDIETLGNQMFCDLGSFFRDKISFYQIM